ncbi:hypothetical protein [Weissella cibaria]|uniref:Uncharacterized protein n=1 Tax=Weissella cibaria TaxID=137591 RepID=A0A2S1KQ25_9LACO|nr:hypothetical protein [Weissella cibaria]AWF95119.1 hypothetical protein B6254_0709 [Weissella cibaria]
MKKYKITKKMLGYLEIWKANNHLDATTREPTHFVNGQDLTELPFSVRSWKNDPINPIERNERMIAIIQWLDGKNVFEVEKPNAFVVRSKKTDFDDEYRYLELRKIFGMEIPNYSMIGSNYAEMFETRMDAELWTTNGYEVVELDGDSKEVTD